MPNTLELVRELILPYGPPGEEGPIRAVVAAQMRRLGYAPETDAKGNLSVTVNGDRPGPSVLVTAHLDEIALMITQIEGDGTIRAAAYGGAYPWKWGEGPMTILARPEPVPAILSFGCIHTNHEKSVVEFARHNPLTFDRAHLFTGMSAAEQAKAGIRPGLRVVLAESRRVVTVMGDFICSYFLDDRADVAVLLMALESLAQSGAEGIGPVTFAATTSEEVGAEGAQYLLRNRPADICVALEIGPRTPEAEFALDAQPTIWVRDGYAAMEAIDGELLTECCSELGQKPHWQYLSRGGSDASCAAQKGLTARPVTLGLPVENSHGYELMHRDAPQELTRLLLAYLRRCAAG